MDETSVQLCLFHVGCFCFHFLFGCVFVPKGNVLQWRRWIFIPENSVDPWFCCGEKWNTSWTTCRMLILNYCRMNAPLLFSQWIKALKTFSSVSLVFSNPLFNLFSVNSGNTNQWFWTLNQHMGHLPLNTAFTELWKVHAVLMSSFSQSFNISILENEDELFKLGRSNIYVYASSLHCFR